MIKYEILNGKPRAIIERKKGMALTNVCPFCGDQHEHSLGDGHRTVHCRNEITQSYLNIEIMTPDGTILRSRDGYIIKEIPQ